MKENSKNQKIFSVKSNLTQEEYSKLFKSVPDFYWHNVKHISLKLLPIILIFLLINKVEIIESIIIYFIIIFIVALIYKIRINWLARKSYETYIKHKVVDKETTLDFYDDYIEKITEEAKIKLQYKDIAKIVETDENFYILNSKNIININKEDCDSKMIDFIKKIDSKYQKKKSENKKSIVNVKKTRTILLIIFFLTLFSIYGAAISVNIAAKNVDIGILSIKKMWICWLWLPIPVLSIILGFKYKNTEIKCTKNIVAGFIVGFILFAFGFYTFLLPSITVDYNEINNYKEIVKVELPQEGVLQKEHYKEMYDSDKKSFTITRAMYGDTKATKDLEKLINNSEYWMKSSKVKSELKSMIPSHCHIFDKDVYYLIYNKDTKEYNTLPEKQREYHIYVVLYYCNNHTLEITDFKYNFVK